MVLLLSKDEMEKIVTQSESSYPTECCGLLIGLEGSERKVQEARPCLNAASEEARIRYKIDPRTLIEAERELVNSGKLILGIYHSHPDYPAHPSKFDLDHAWPWYSYLVLSVKRGHFIEAASWRLSKNLTDFQSEELKILD